MLKYLFIVSFFFCISISAEIESDSTDFPLIIDTTFTDTLQFDTTGIDIDTLTEGQVKLLQFKYRQEKRKEGQEEEIKEVLNYFSFYDSLVVTFLHPRLNSSSYIKKSFTKDAGDYFKGEPSYFLKDNQQTPMRKTVRPFGLSGNRMNIISNGTVLSPFEHIPEPDGLVDFNDIPTGLTKDIFILPGGIGQLFGGEQSIATLVTVPNQTTTFEPEIKLQLNKGPLDYAFTRGGYTKFFSDGKEVDLSVDYRNTIGIRDNTDDNGKHFAGRTLIPLKSSYYLFASGNSYRRKGSYKSVLSRGTQFITRSRTDKNGFIAIEKLNDEQTAKYQIGYEYTKQNSNLDGAYKGRFNYFGNKLKLSKESLFGSAFLKSELSYSSVTQFNGYEEDSEKSAKASVAYVQKSEQSSIGATVGTIYDKEYNFLPFVSGVYQKYSDKKLFMLSLGYSEKAPSMHDRNLKLQTNALYTGIDSTISLNNGYADVGYKNLLSEKQLIGSVIYEYGSIKSNVRMSLTGGLINDGIDWYQNDTIVETIPVKLFSPKNSDITFADIQVKQKLSVSDLLSLSIGGAYHFIEYDYTDTRPYQPDYQMFLGGELHHYWKQKIIDLYAYGEAVYNAEYVGYFDETLGGNININTGVAFELKKFRFYYIFQNAFPLYRPNPDGSNNLGQFSYYGLTWYFLN